MPRSFPSVRLSLLCLMAIAVALPIAIISTAKLLLFLCVMVVIVSRWIKGTSISSNFQDYASPAILLAMAGLAMSSLWSTGSINEALAAWAKHSKLLLIPIILYLIQSRREALIIFAFFMMGQAFLLISTWMMFIGVDLPWAISSESGFSYAVFSSYLDQSIMTAVFASLCWHMRSYLALRISPSITMMFTGLALVCVFFIFQGRTGHLVAVTLISLAVMWKVPPKIRIGVVVLPFVLLAILVAGSSKVHRGLSEIGSSIGAFNKSGDISTSSGIRLNLWHRSIESIAENPLYGTGVGSWSQEFNKQEALHAPGTYIKISGNPHQEYLLWGVEMGLIGIALICTVIGCLYLDSQRLERPARMGMQSVLAALVLASFFNCSLYDALIGDFFCVSIALILAFTKHANSAKESTNPTTKRL